MGKTHQQQRGNSNSASDDGLAPERLLAEDGRLPYGRRLTDKILHAYAQAYAQGERRIAAGLRKVLEEAEVRGRQRHPERRGLSAVRQADLWTAFCDARELYRQAVEPDGGGEAGSTSGRGAKPPVTRARLEATLEIMRIAYLRWRRAI